jgi:nucleotide-binding universal stress UspA family protein
MFKHILLATDGSTSAEHAAKKALELARVHGAHVTAAYVVDPYPYIGIGEVNPMALQSYMTAAQNASTQVFVKLADLAAANGVQLQVQLVENMQAARGIVQLADQVAADLIVIGSHGRSGVEKLVLGSVAAKVVALSTRPVLVIR